VAALFLEQIASGNAAKRHRRRDASALGRAVFGLMARVREIAKRLEIASHFLFLSQIDRLC